MCFNGLQRQKFLGMDIRVRVPAENEGASVGKVMEREIEKWGERRLTNKLKLN